MTIEQDKLNAVFLSALMVLSVFVGSIAFAGSAAAASGLSVDSSTPAEAGGTVDVSANASTAGNDVTFTVTDAAGNVVNETIVTSDGTSGEATATLRLAGDAAAGTATVVASDSSSNTSEETFEIEDDASGTPSIASAIEFNDGDIEIAFNENVQAVDNENVTVSVNGEDDNTNFTASTSTTGTEGRLVIDGERELKPSDSVEVTVGGQDNNGETFFVSTTVTTTSTTFDQSTLTDGTSHTAQAGSQVVYNANAEEDPIDIAKQVDSDSQWEPIFSGTTGVNSHLFVFDTSEQETNANYRFSSTSGKFTLSDYSLKVDAPQTATNLQPFTYTVSSSVGGDEIKVEFIKDGKNSGETMTRTLDGDMDSEFQITPDGTGNYTIVVTHKNTGVTVESDTVTVEKQGEAVINFGDGTTGARGDVVEIPVHLQNTENNEAAVQIGADGAAYRVNMNVTDGNGDGVVTLLVNTYDVNADATERPNDAKFGISVKDSANDKVTDVDGTGVESPLDSGTYDLTAGEDNTDSGASALGAFTVQNGGLNDATGYIAPNRATFDETVNTGDLTQRTSVALHDQVVVKVDGSGIFGKISDDETLTESGDLSLKLTEVNPGKNDDGYNVSESAIDVIPDAENESLYLIIDTNDLPSDTPEDDGALEAGMEFNVTLTHSDEALVGDNAESVSTDFTIDAQTASINTNNDDVVELAAGTSEATLSGTSTLAPGTTVRVQVRADNNEFLDTVQTTVNEDGTWSVAYDTSDVETGATFNAAVLNYMDTSTDGEFVDSVSTTTEPGTTETPPSTTKQPTTSQSTTEKPQTSESPGTTSTEEPSDGGVPGFGLSAALIALIGAALIAHRRD